MSDAPSAELAKTKMTAEEKAARRKELSLLRARQKLEEAGLLGGELMRRAREAAAKIPSGRQRDESITQDQIDDIKARYHSFLTNSHADEPDRFLLYWDGGHDFTSIDDLMKQGSPAPPIDVCYWFVMALGGDVIRAGASSVRWAHIKPKLLAWSEWYWRECGINIKDDDWANMRRYANGQLCNMDRLPFASMKQFLRLGF